MKKIYLFLVVLTMLGCFRDNGNGCTSNYRFEVPLSLNFPNGQLNVGDTLSITMHTDNTMLVDLLVEGRTVNFPDFDPFIHFYFVSLDSLPIVDGFDVHDITVHAGNNAEVKNGVNLSDILVFLDIDKRETKSKLGFDIVMKRRGIFALYAGTLLDYIDERDFIDFPDRCGGRCCSLLDAWPAVNSGIDNAHLLTVHNKDIEDQYWFNYTGERERSFPFYFKVE